MKAREKTPAGNPDDGNQPQIVNEQDQDNPVNPRGDESLNEQPSSDFSSEPQMNKAANLDEKDGGSNNYDVDSNPVEETDDTSTTTPKVNP